MKKLVLVLLLLPTLAYAETVDVTYRDKDSHKDHKHDAIRTTTATVHDKYEPDTEAGVGADVILWENEDREALVENVNTQYKYDINNKNHSIYGVVQVNLWHKIKKFFNR
jgi:hypothetical protein